MCIIANIKKLTILLLTSLLMSSTLYSQSIVLNNLGDTTICFSIPQSKFLLKNYYRTMELEKLDSICEKQLKISDSLSYSQKIIIQDQDLIIKNNDLASFYREQEIKSLSNELIDEKKKTIKQKALKRFFIFLGIGTTAFSTYLGIIK